MVDDLNQPPAGSMSAIVWSSIDTATKAVKLNALVLDAQFGYKTL